MDSPLVRERTCDSALFQHSVPSEQFYTEVLTRLAQPAMGVTAGRVEMAVILVVEDDVFIRAIAEFIKTGAIGLRPTL